MATSHRPLCADISAEMGESLNATASRVDHWILLEYRGLWSPDALRGSALTDAVKAHLAEQLGRRLRSRLLFIRRPERRGSAGIVCYAGSTPERGGRFSRLELEGYDDLVGLDPFEGEQLEHPLLAVCTHGKRDRCCARYGRPLYDAICDQLDPDWVWQCTHVGGDRFAGNVVCFPEGLYFGRVGRADVWPLLDDYLAGRIYLDCYRGRSAYSMPAQAAERLLRARLGLTGHDDLELLGVDRRNGGWLVSFEAAGDRHQITVTAEEGELAYLTCDAETPKRPRRFVAQA